MKLNKTNKEEQIKSINDLKCVDICDRTEEEKTEIIEFLTKIDRDLAINYLLDVIDKECSVDFVVGENGYDVKNNNKNKIISDFLYNSKLKNIKDLIYEKYWK